MKKITSLLLAFSLLATTLLFSGITAKAVAYPTLSTGSTEIVLEDDQYYTFTPSKTGLYEFSSEEGEVDYDNGGSDPVMGLYLGGLEKENWIDPTYGGYDDGYADGCQFDAVYSLTANTTYIVYFETYDEDISYTVNVETVTQSFNTLDMGDNDVVFDGRAALYKFTPTETAEYFFFSAANESDSDPAIYLYSDKNLTTECDVTSGDNDDIDDTCQFECTYELEANHTYYIVFETYEYEESCYVSVSKSIDFINFGTVGTKTITVGDDGYGYYTFTPDETAVYNFSSSSSECDPFVNVYTKKILTSSCINVISGYQDGTYNDDDDFVSSDFNCDYLLVGGQTYYISFDNCNKESTSYDVTINQVGTISYVEASDYVIYDGFGRQVVDPSNGDAVVITYDDYTAKYVYDDELMSFVYDDNFIDFYYVSTEDFDDWSFGSHTETMYLNCNGSDFELSVPVEYKANPVTSFSLKQENEPELIIGYNTYEEDGVTYAYGSVYSEGDVLTIVYNDGRGSIDYTYTETEDGYSCFMDVDGNVVDDPEITEVVINGAGEYAMTLTYAEKVSTINVNVIESPVASFEYNPVKEVKYLEGYNGWYEYDDETYMYNAPAARVGDTITVTYKDDTTETYTAKEVTDGGITYVDFVDDENNILKNVFYIEEDAIWSIGSDNEYKINVLGTEETFNATVEELPFTDVSNYIDGYSDYLSYIYGNQYIKGTSATTFSPTKSVTRAMYIAILYRMAGSPYDNGNNPYKKTPFSDIKDTTVYYYNAACWALDNGVTTQTKFNPNGNVTREQFVTFLYRYVTNVMGVDYSDVYEYMELDYAFSDSEKISSWATTSIAWAYSQGIVSGTQQGTFNPKGSTQRIHATKMFAIFGQMFEISNSDSPYQVEQFYGIG